MMKYNEIKEVIKSVIDYQSHEDNVRNYVDAIADSMIAESFTDSAYDAICDNLYNDAVIRIDVYPRYSRVDDSNIAAIDMGEVQEVINTDLTDNQLKAIIKKLNSDSEINNDVYVDPDSIENGSFTIYMQPGQIHIDLIDGEVVKSKIEDKDKETLSLSTFKKIIKRGIT